MIGVVEGFPRYVDETASVVRVYPRYKCGGCSESESEVYWLSLMRVVQALVNISQPFHQHSTWRLRIYGAFCVTPRRLVVMLLLTPSTNAACSHFQIPEKYIYHIACISFSLAPRIQRAVLLTTG